MCARVRAIEQTAYRRSLMRSVCPKVTTHHMKINYYTLKKNTDLNRQDISKFE